MKKLLALTIIAGTSIGIATGCAKTGTSSLSTAMAYGLVHRGYYGSAEVSLVDGKIGSVLIDETFTKFISTETDFREVSASSANAAFATMLVDQAYQTIKYGTTPSTDAADTVCYKYESKALQDAFVPTFDKGTAKDVCASGWSLLTTSTTLNVRGTGAETGVGKLDGYKLASGYTLHANAAVTAAKMTIPNSKKEAYNTPVAYWPEARNGLGWYGNMKKIQDFFVGKTWNDIKDLNEFVTGATATDTNQYGQLVKLAAKKAFGK